MSGHIVPENRLRRTLQERGTAAGCMLVELRQTSIMTVLANAGFDFVIIDGEHGPFGIETIADLSRAARAAGVTPIVRVPEVTYAHVTRPLDGGAQGIMIPRITSGAQVKEAVAMMKYPPQGKRGSVLARGHTQFLGGPLQEALQEGNRETFLIVQIETKEALEGVAELVAVPGVDAVLVGPTDLSVALGIPGKLTDPLIQNAVDRVVGACRQRNVVPAVHVNVLEQGTLWAGRGMRMVSFNSEIGLLAASGGSAVQTLRAALGAPKHLEV